MPYHLITPDEVRSRLDSDPPHTGKLATARADGRPHVAPVWFVLEPDGSVLVTTSEDSVKGRNLRHAGRAALCVDEEAPPYAFVLMEGRVDLIDDLAELRAIAAASEPATWAPMRPRRSRPATGSPGDCSCVSTPTRSPVPPTSPTPADREGDREDRCGGASAGW
jgi:PPOX class probable F420-dependent enzyme